MSKGTEDQFNRIVAELAKNAKQYEEKKVKHYQYAEIIDNIFSNSGNGWDKASFYKELDSRLGIQTNETRVRKSNPPPAKKKIIKT